MKKTITGTVLTVALMFGTAGSCDNPKPRDPGVFEVNDCDEDDSVAKGDMECLKPSGRPRPMKTVYQPKPTPKKTR